MTTYRPRRSVLYRAFVKLVLVLAVILCVFAGPAVWSGDHWDVVAWLRINALLLVGVILAGAWVIECAIFFVRKTRLSIDEKGLSFVNAEGPVEAEWADVSKIYLGRWEVFISVPGKDLGMPLLTRAEQEEIRDTWFKMRGFSLSRLPKNALPKMK